MKKIISFLLIAVSVLVFPLSVACWSFDTETEASFKKAFGGKQTSGLFRQEKRIMGGSRCLVSEGTVLIDKDLGIAYITEKPYQSVLVAGKNSLVQSVRGGKPVRLAVSGSETYSQIAGVISSVFSGDINLLQSGFDADTKKDGSSFVINLYPHDSIIKSFIERIEVRFLETPESVLIVQTTGDSVLYQFTQMQTREFTEDEKEIFQM